jgi:selenophosphate synthetase-related protein
MNDVAEKHLVTAAKDVSVAGLVGTAAMMLEYSGRGGIIDLDRIDIARPQDIILDDWLRMYISLGFLVATRENLLPPLKQVCKDHGLSVCRIGTVDNSREVKLSMGEESLVLFDFAKGPVLTPKTGHD